MVMIDGEKWACEACVRGHRVSNCQHKDRPLTHINKKGRPVSQCQHCRGLRKSRASHVSCQCGDKPHGKDDPVHAGQGDSTSELDEDNRGFVSDYGTVDSPICCCTHGMRCTCALKKEHLDAVPEASEIEPLRPLNFAEIRKPRLSTASSESSLTIFTNGHHKPAHKHNNSALRCGVPYTIPRPHSIHGSSELSSQRSLESLPLSRTFDDTSSYFPQYISNIQQQPRAAHSERASPSLIAMQGPPSTDLDTFTLDPFTYGAAPEEMANHTFPGFDASSTPPEEQALYSAGPIAPSVDWSAFDFRDTGILSNNYSQPPSYASYDQNNLSQPGLTTSSSGEVSEVGDVIPQSVPSPSVISQRQSTADSADVENLYRLSPASSYAHAPAKGTLPTRLLDKVDNSGLVIHRTTASPAEFEEHGPHPDAENFAMHALTVQEAQKVAHTSVPAESLEEMPLPSATKDNTDPLWAASFEEYSTFDAQEQPLENPDPWAS